MHVLGECESSFVRHTSAAELREANIACWGGEVNVRITWGGGTGVNAIHQARDMCIWGYRFYAYHGKLDTSIRALNVWCLAGQLKPGLYAGGEYRYARRSLIQTSHVL